MNAPTIANGMGDSARPVATSRHDLVCRAGYAAHGVVYLLVGVLAVDAALGGGGQGVEGEHEAISRLGRGAFGTALLTLLGAGLLAYSYMRVWQAIANPGRRGAGPKGAGARVGRVASGLASAGLALYALSLAYGWFAGGMLAGGGDRAAADLTARVMHWPGGRLVVGAIGLGVCIAAVAQMTLAVTAGFMRDLAVPSAATGWVRGLGRAGYAARAIVFLIAGGFVILAAIRARPGEVQGLEGALRTLRSQPYGPWLLALTGAGLAAFAAMRGVYVRYAISADRARG